MSTETVVIKIKVDADTRAIQKVQAQLAALSAQGAASSDSLDDLADSEKRVSRESRTVSQRLDDTSSRCNKLKKSSDGLSKGFGTFAKILKTGVGLALKGLMINAGLLAAALVGVNLAFKAGAALAKAWSWTVNAALTAAAGAAGIAATALFTLAAAQREYNAAVSSAAYGGSTERAMTALRNMQANTELAVLGGEAIQGAFAAISKSTPVTGQLNQALTALGDFAIAGGDPTKGLQAAGEFLGQLVKKGRLTDDVKEAAAEVGPQFAKAVKDASKKGLTDSTAFLNALVSGQLSGEVAGTLDNVNNTLFGTVKRNFNLLKSQAADIGQAFLPGFTDAFEKIGRILQRTIIQIAGPLNKFAKGTMTDGLVGAMDKIASWTVKMFNEYLPKTEGMIGRIKDFFKEIRVGWNEIVNRMRPFQEAGQVLIDTLRPTFDALFGGLSDGLQQFNDLVLTNRDNFLEFGDALGRFFESVGKIYGQIKEAFAGALPTITAAVDGVTNLVDMLSRALETIKSLTGFLGNNGSGFAQLAAVFGGYMALGRVAERRTGSRGSGPLNRTGRAAFGRGGPSGVGTNGLSTGMAVAQTGLGGSSAGVVNISAGAVYLNGPVMGAAGRGVPPVWGPPTGPAQPGPGRPGVPGGMAAARPSRFGNIAAALPMYLPFIGAFAEGAGVPGGTAAGVAGTAAYYLGKAGYLGKIGGYAALPAIGGAIAGDVGSNFALNKWSKNQSSAGQTATGVLSGVASGAVAGGTIGGMIGALPAPIAPISVPVGIAVGTVIGATVGGIKGWMNSGKYKKESRETARQFVEDYTGPMEEALARGDVKTYERLARQMERQSDGVAAGSKHVESFNKEFDKLSKEVRSQAAPAIERYNENVERLSSITGLSAERIGNLARKMGIDLTGSIKNIEKVASDLSGSPIWGTLAERTAWLSENIATAAVNAFTKPQKEKDAVVAVDQAGQDIRDVVLSGGQMDSAAAGEYLLKAFEFEMIRNGDNPLKAFRQLYKGVGTEQGQMFTKEGSQFFGMGAQLAPQFNELINSAAGDILSKKDVRTYVRNTANQVERQSEGDLTITNQGQVVKDIMRDIKGGNWGKVNETIKNLNRLTSPEGRTFQRMPKEGTVDFAARVDRAAKRIAGVNFGVQIKSGLNPLLAIPNQIRIAIAEALTTPINVEVTVRGGKRRDTSTPRGAGDTTSSRLGRTFNRHAYLDAQLTGKRMITSSWRDWGLGSINSDHVTGQALDLVGQNLGAYKKLVEAGGGFAEFHGVGGDRHLHTVPGPGPAGDRGMPVPSMASASSTSYTSQDTYSISIASQPNASASDIADQVMARIERRGRTARERGM